MRNVVPSWALSRRSYRALVLTGLALAVGFFMFFASLALKELPLSSPTARPTQEFLADALFLVSIGVILIGLGLGVRVLIWTWRSDNDLAKIVGNTISAYMSDDYVFIRNVSKIGLGYIDAVLVSVNGILVFRIMDKTGTFLNEGDRWLKFNPRDKTWSPAGIEPTRQAIADVDSLKAYLSTRGYSGELPVMGIVVFMKDAAKLSFKNSVLPATPLSGLYRQLQTSYLNQVRFSREAAAGIVKLLYQ